MKKVIYLLAVCSVALVGCKKNQPGTVAFYTDANISQGVDIYINGEYKKSLYASIKHVPDCNDYYVVKIQMPEGRYTVTAITGPYKSEKLVTWSAGVCKVTKL